MHDLNRALADLGAIRAQVARGTVFRGYGPPIVAVTGGLAVLAAAAQWLWFADLVARPIAFVVAWAVVAALALALIGIEALTRSRRLHSGLADEMILAAAEQFMPAAAAGTLLSVVVLRAAPESAWLLPGLWQILVGLGMFASVRLLPRTVSLAAAWYVASGLVCVALASETHLLSPWFMGLPFGIGQSLFALALHTASGETDE